MVDFPDRLGAVEQSYRQSVIWEASFAITLDLMGVSGIIWGDDFGRRFGVVTLLLAVALALYIWRKLRRRLHRCAGGLLIVSHPRRPGIEIAWSDIAHVRAWNTNIYKMDGPPENLYRCVLHLASGQKLNLAAPPYVNGAELTESVVRHVAAVMHPAKLSELQSHGAVAFGPLTVTHDGITDARHFAAWTTITRIDLGRVRLRIWADKTHPVISRQVRTIPDVAVLTKIIASKTRR